MRKKTFILDTNVILHDPTCIYQFDEHDIILPITVLEEIDFFKRGSEQINFHAREFVRTLDGLVTKDIVEKGVLLGDGKGKISIMLDQKLAPEVKENFPTDNPDRHILNVAFFLKQTSSRKDFILVSKDTNLRLKALSLGVSAEDYLNDHVEDSTLGYTGFSKVENVPSETIDELFNERFIRREDIEDTLKEKVYSNQFHIWKNGKKSGLTMYDSEKDGFSLIEKLSAHGIHPKNAEQIFALNALLNDNIQLVTMEGKAGGGKTLLSLAAAIEKRKNYKQILLARPIIALSNRDIGYLPGDIGEKLDPYMQPLWDNLSFIQDQFATTDRKNIIIKDMLDTKKLKIQPLAYIRGRSLHNVFFIVDECFPYDQRVICEDKKREIGSLFVEFIRGNDLPKVLSFDEQSKTFQYKKILRVIHSGVKDFIEVNFSGKKVRCTSNHLFLTNHGWVQAKDLVSNDVVISHGTQTNRMNQSLNDDQKQIVIGSYLGNGNVHGIKNRNFRLSITHGESQAEYCKWKADMFGVKAKIVNGSSRTPAIRFSSKMFVPEFEMPENKRSCSDDFLKTLDAKSLAIWFMDDGSIYEKENGGSISTHSFDLESHKRMISRLKEMGINCTIRTTTKRGKVIHSVDVLKDGIKSLSKMISPFVHPSMEYKLCLSDRNSSKYAWDTKSPDYELLVVSDVGRIISSGHAFDLEVEDTHNFVIDGGSSLSRNQSGIVVHNCQNLTPHEIKTIITRAGEGTKIVFTGDTNQIDHPYLDKRSNGLSYLVEKFKGQKIFSHIRLIKGERSNLADLASELL
jgi:PhoH-like ATPase